MVYTQRVYNVIGSPKQDPRLPSSSAADPVCLIEIVEKGAHTIKEGALIPRFIRSIKVDRIKDSPVGVITFTEPLEVLSCAVLNGGSSVAEAAFIMEVPKDFDCDDYMGYIGYVRDALGLPDNSVGMMTAAEVDHVFNVKTSTFRGKEATAFATAGLANHVIAGEELLDYDAKTEVSIRRMNALRPGTINIGVISPRPLTTEAKVNLMIPLVEAKTLAMRRQGFLETGTTSDSMAVFCPVGDDREMWAGTGSDLGIAAARAVSDAVQWSLKARDEHPSPLRPDDVLNRLGMDRESLYAKYAGDSDRERFMKGLDKLFSRAEIVSALDIAYTMAFRADSVADDGSEVYLETVKGMIACTLGSKKIPKGHLMDAVLAMIADKASKY